MWAYEVSLDACIFVLGLFGQWVIGDIEHANFLPLSTVLILMVDGIDDTK